MSLGKDQIGIVSGKMGMRKKVELAKKAITMNLKFSNFNPQKYLDMDKTKAKTEKKTEKKEEKPAKKETKK